MHKPFKPLVLGAALAMSSSAFAAGTTDFSDWDSNRDDMLSKDEFQSGMRSNGLFDSWDTNNDGNLDRTEYDGVGWDYDYADWDYDDDGLLTENETYGGVFSAYDGNEDGHWDVDEWDDVGDEGWFDA